MGLPSCFIVAFLCFTVVSCMEHSDNTIGEHDCCPLKWEKMSFPGLIPIDAVVAGEYKGQKKYFSVLTHKFASASEEKIGVKTENNREGVWYESNSRAFLYEPGCLRTTSGGSCTSDSPNDEILILTNPENCTIAWWKRQSRRQMPDETYQKLYPRVGGHHFARRRYSEWEGSCTGAGSVDFLEEAAANDAPRRPSLLDELFRPRHSRNSRIWNSNGNTLSRYSLLDELFNFPRDSTHGGGYHEVYQWRVRDTSESGTEIMFLDCVSSVSNVISAELIDIQFDLKTLTAGRAEVILDTTTIENNSSKDQTTEVTLTASIEKSFQFSYSTTVSNHLKVGVSAGLNIFNLLQIGIEAGYDYTTLATEGKIRIDRHVETSTKKQVVLEAPFSRTTVDYVSTPIEGRNIPFKATYKINVLDPDWPIANATRALRRIGFKDMDTLQVVNGDMILSYEGQMTVVSGYNTRITVNQEPIV